MITIETAVVYRSSSGRRYLTKRGAIQSDARKIIVKKYPYEPFDPQDGSSFRWEQMDRSDVLFRRLCRLIESTMVRK